MSKLKHKISDVGGVVIKDDEIYRIKDNKFLNKLIVSSTELRAGKSTRGHKHPGQEEVYFFVDGKGRMEVDNEMLDVQDGDVVLIPDGAFHRVHNYTDKPLYFVCVFDGQRNH